MSTNLVDVVGKENANEIEHQLQKLKTPLNIVMPQSVAECMDRVVFLANRQFTDAAEAGFILLNVKEQVSHGEFLTLLEERGIHKRTAQRSIAISKMLSALPKGKSDKLSLLNMSQHQLSELTKVPLESIAQLDDDDLDVLAETSGKEIRAQVQKLTERTQELEESTATLINALETERLIKAPKQMYELPMLVAQVRQKSFAHNAVVNESLEEFIAMAEQLCNARDLDLNHRIGAAQTTWHLWLGIQQRITHMLNRLSGEFGPEHLAGAECIPQFAEDEWQDAQANREYMLAMFNDRIKTRE
jgi:arsenate reductase-like glutaredoxin family protein